MHIYKLSNFSVQRTTHQRLVLGPMRVVSLHRFMMPLTGIIAVMLGYTTHTHTHTHGLSQVKSCILDGEMVGWNAKSETIL